MKGYYNNARRDARGDRRRRLAAHRRRGVASIADGCVRITGRIKDIIIRGGENIAPKEIEDRLREHPAVADAYVYGVRGCVLRRGGGGGGAAEAGASRRRTTADELIAWCAADLAKFKVPALRAGSCRSFR